MYYYNYYLLLLFDYCILLQAQQGTTSLQISRIQLLLVAVVRFKTCSMFHADGQRLSFPFPNIVWCSTDSDAPIVSTKILPFDSSESSLEVDMAVSCAFLKSWALGW